MKNFKILVLTFVLVTGLGNMQAQNARIAKRVSNTSTAQASTPWIIGLGYGFIENNGEPLSIFKIKDSWIGVPYPSRLSGEKIIASGISLEGVVTFNKYKPGKDMNHHIVVNDRTYFSFDAMAKYDLNELFGETSFFDPFVMVGYGYHYHSIGDDLQKNLQTGSDHNVGLGFNLWITQEIGMGFETMGKWINKKTTSNHLEHSVSLVYKFGGSRGKYYIGDSMVEFFRRL